MSDLTHEPKHGDWSYECIHCGEQDVPITEDCPDHPDRTEEDDLTHKRGGKRCLVDHGKGCSCIECEFCGEFIRPSGFDDSCLEHPDRQRENDDDGEGDERREVAKRFLEGENPPSITQDVEWSATLVLEAIRDHCELSDSKIEWPVCHYCQPEGKTEPIMESEQAVTIHQYHLEELSDEEDEVCEWVKDGDTVHPECHEADYGIKIIDIWNFCPGCKGEITTDDGGEYEYSKGQLWRMKNDFNEWSYWYCLGKNDEIGGCDWISKDNSPKGIDKLTSNLPLREVEEVGSFKPDDDALERVPEWVRGELVVLDNDEVAIDPVGLPGNALGDYHARAFVSDDAQIVGGKDSEYERTGIVLESFHQIEEEA